MQDPILFWNSVALEANRLDHTPGQLDEHHQGPGLSSRAIAIIHLAMHDAYFGVAGVTVIPGPTTPARSLYLSMPPVYTGSNTDVTRSAAVSGAAATILTALYAGPLPASSFRAMIEAKLAEITASNGTDSTAFSFGRRVANAVLALRSSDGAFNTADQDYMHTPAPPRHREDPYNPTQGFLGVAHGRVTSFAVTQWHALAPPPQLSDPLYKKHYKQVYEDGGAPALNTTKRTPDQTAIGLYWAYDGAMQIGTPPRLYNQIVREIAIKRGNSWEKNARLFALVNVAMGDSGIHAWHWKYCYDFWRPVLGVRENDPSTGPAAVADKEITPPSDPFWQPLGAPRSNQVGAISFTPGFPAYPSGHATFGAATFEIVRLFYKHCDKLKFKDNDVDPIGFEFVSEELDGSTLDSDGSVRTRHNRKFDSMAEAMYENSISRIYLGVHWRFDGTTGDSTKEMLQATDNIGGVPLGRAIAQDIFNSGMKQQAKPPMPPTKKCV
jgi:vanadium chloroperoxidase